MGLALHIIAKDEVEQVKRIITDYGKYFDEIAIAVDDRLEEFNTLADNKVKIHPYEWRNDFAHKRNFLAEKTESPYYFRMDTDDSIDNPEVIRKHFDAMVSNSVDILYAMYDYAKDENGNVIAKHWRETIIKKRPDVYWKKEIHENMFMENIDSCRISKMYDLKIIHNIDNAHAIESSKRNFEYLFKEFMQNKENTDPRTLAYLGRMLMAKGDYEKSIFFLEKLVLKSGWDDDRYFAYVQMAQCYQFMDKPDIAISCCNEALSINTQYPDAYIQMGMVYIQKEDYVKATDWIMPGIVRPEPNTVMVLDPSFYKINARVAAAVALFGKGDTEQALKYIKMVEAIEPKNPDVARYKPLMEDAIALSRFINNIMWMCCYLKAKDPSKLRGIIESVPSHVYRDERMWNIRHSFLPPKIYADNEIAIFCGSSWEEWSPANILTGLGGSEEAVVYISRELVKLGYKVTVFNNCGESCGEYDGVEYKSYHAFNPKDKYNVVISWRGHDIRNVDAKNRIVWLHDVPMPNMFTEESVKYIDKIIVLSQFHKSLLGSHVPKEKVFVSSNGINTADFINNGILRNPKRMIYTSSYDRGLEHLLRMWSEIRQEVPDAEIHIFYGWDVYDKMVKQGARDPKFKQMLSVMMVQDGIFEHGRIGHKALVKELQKSGIWSYPSHFEEISCISAMKAQAAGCIPVCTDYAALDETVKYGFKVKGSMNSEETRNNYKVKLIEVLKGNQEPAREEVVKNKYDFGWDKVAKQWKENIL